MCGRFNRLVRAFCFMLCGVYSVQINAAIGGEAVFKTMNITGKSRASYGIKVDYAVKTQFDHPSIPQNKNVSAGFMAADLAVLFASLKNRNPGAVAVTAGTVAAAAAAGWVIDELTGQITKPVETDGGYTEGYYWATLDGMLAGYSAHTLPGVVAKLPDTYSVDTFNYKKDTLTTSGTNKATQRYVDPANYHFVQNIFKVSCASYPNPICSTSPDPVTEWQPVSESELNDKVKDWLKTAPWSILDDLLKHPDGTTVDNEPLRRAISDWLDDLASKDPNLRYVPPASIVVTNPDGSETPVEFEPNPEPDSSTDDKTRPDAADWPLFCEWAPVICDWLEWTKEMPEDMEPEEFPVEELTVADIRKDYNSGLGGGSCPSPVTTSFMGSQIVFSYETACYGARTFFKPVLLMIAGIIAAFIIVGASRRT